MSSEKKQKTTPPPSSSPSSSSDEEEEAAPKETLSSIDAKVRKEATLEEELQKDFVNVYLSIEDSLQSLKSFEDILHSKDANKILQDLYWFSLRKNSDRRLTTVYANRLKYFGFLEVFNKVWEEYWKGDFLEEKEENILPNSIYSNTDSIMHNCSDKSAELCELLWEEGVVKKLVDLFRTKDEFRNKDLMTGPNGARKTAICSAALGTIHNCVHYFPARNLEFRAMGGVESVLPVLSFTVGGDLDDMMKQRHVRGSASMIIAKTVAEENQDALRKSSKMLNYFIKSILSNGLKKRSRTYNGFSIRETLVAIKSIAAAVDGVRGELGADPDSLIIFYRVFLSAHDGMDKDKDMLIELRLILKIFFIISFDEGVKQSIRDSLPDFVAKVKPLLLSEDREIQNAVEGALWNINGKRPVTSMSQHPSALKKMKKKEKSSKISNTVRRATIFGGGGAKETSEEGETRKAEHVMISYNWAYQDIAKAVNLFLRDAGYNTWLDIEKMSGSTLEAMASAVENASVILVCYSEAYRKSPNCQKEAEYADQLQKRIVPIRTQDKYQPDGWLGIMMGRKLFFKCSSPQEVSTTGAQILSQLEKFNVTPKGQSSIHLNQIKSAALSDPIPGRITISRNGKKPIPSLTNGKRVQSLDRLNDSLTNIKLNSWRKELESLDSNELKTFLEKNTLSSGLIEKFRDYNGALFTQLVTIYQKPSQQLFLLTLEKSGIDSAQNILELTMLFEKIVVL